MTQFGPPPYPPPGMSLPDSRSGPSPWSASAIGAFVLSLLGFIGITAVLGLIFAIVGIVATRGGLRRGRGLAIAALPISLVTGACAVLIVMAFLLFGRMMQVPHQLEPVFTGGDPVTQAAVLRKLTSDTWNQTVKDEPLQAWLTSVRKKHGAIIGLSVDPSRAFALSSEGEPQLSVAAKFVNGPATLRITFDADDLGSVRVWDVEVDGSSVRRASEAASPPESAPASE